MSESKNTNGLPLPENIKVFISYSWTTQDHQESVISLGQRLRADGVNVVLDVWDLKEGQDVHKFMEQMVSDPSIKKVLIISDEAYTRKADQRAGGVGTESEIISADIYTKSEQNKFIPVLYQRDQNGQPFLPVFLKSRKYIDFTDRTSEDSYVKLLRVIHDKPENEKPPLGKTPDFLLTSDSSTPVPSRLISISRTETTTSPSQRRRKNVDFLAEAYETLISTDPENKYETEDERVFQEIANKRFVTESIYEYLNKSLSEEFNSVQPALKTFLEKLRSFNDTATTAKENVHYETVGFFIQETIWYVVSILLKWNNFAELEMFLSDHYLIRYSSRKDIEKITSFYDPLEILDRQRNQRLNLRRVCLTADIVKGRCSGKVVTFDELIQADAVVFFRAYLSNNHWFPRLLIYHNAYDGLEIFIRARSKIYFDQIKGIFGVHSIEELRTTFTKRNEEYPLVNYRFLNTFRSFDFQTAYSIDSLATR